MKIELHQIAIREVIAGYKDSDEESRGGLYAEYARKNRAGLVKTLRWKVYP